MKISRKLILGVVLLLLVALILYFINRKNKKERFYVLNNDAGANESTLSLTGDSFQDLLDLKGGVSVTENYKIDVNNEKLEIKDIISFGEPFKN